MFDVKLGSSICLVCMTLDETAYYIGSGVLLSTWTVADIYYSVDNVVDVTLHSMMPEFIDMAYIASP